MIFLDTGFLFAYMSGHDENHERVCAVIDGHRGQRLGDLLLTTNHVVAETITLLRARGHRDPSMSHDLAVRVGDQLFAGAFGHVHHATQEEERAAFDYFAKYRDKRYSFVDCLSFVVMARLGIREAWAVDSDFTHNFAALPGPSTTT